AGGQPLRGDAEPARGRRVHRRRQPCVHLPALVVEGAVAALAGVGLVLGDGDREPLLARLRRRPRRGADRGRDRPPPAALPPPGNRLTAEIGRPPRDPDRGPAEGGSVPRVTREMALERVKQGYTNEPRRRAARA